MAPTTIGASGEWVRVSAQIVAPAPTPPSRPRTMARRSERTVTDAPPSAPKPALSAVPPATADPGHALSTHAVCSWQARLGAPSSARSSAQAVTVFGPVTKAEWAVGTAADSPV